MIPTFVRSNVTPKMMSMFLRFLLMAFSADMDLRRRPYLHIAIIHCLWICRVLNSWLAMWIRNGLKRCAGLRVQTDVSLTMMVLIFVWLLILGDPRDDFRSPAHLSLYVFDLNLRRGWLGTIVIWLNRCGSIVAIHWIRLARAAAWAYIADILARLYTLTDKRATLWELC